MSDCPVCCGMEGYTLHTCGLVSEAIGLELERRENMSEVKIGADDLRKICRNATNPLATIELCLEWADKAEKIALAMQAEVEEQARLLGASGSREAELRGRVEALEKREQMLLAECKIMRVEAERLITKLACDGVQRLTEIRPDAGWDSGEVVAAGYIRFLPEPQEADHE